MESTLIEFDKNVKSYFNDTSNFLEIHNHYQKELERYTSINFNLFKFIHLDENKISEIIVNILNPNGEHGQGTLFLNAFLEIIGIEVKDKKPFIDTEVLTRQHINNLRRMDILIDWIDFGIMIENKPRYDDKTDQLKNYAEDLRNKYGGKNFIMVYLSNDGHFPSEVSISKEFREELEINNQFIHITYNVKFKEWVEKCINICQSEKYKWFLKDFLDYTLNKYL